MLKPSSIVVKPFKGLKTLILLLPIPKPSIYLIKTYCVFKCLTTRFLNWGYYTVKSKT